MIVGLEMNAILLQIERASAGFVDVSENVIFEFVVHASGDISYNSITSDITFNKVGKYFLTGG